MKEDRDVKPACSEEGEEKPVEVVREEEKDGQRKPVHDKEEPK
jgi:hypothetical protein